MFIAVLACCLALAQPGTPGTQDAPRPTGVWNVDAAGVALGGYDPVAYFPGPEGLEGHPTPGTPELTCTVRGVTYRFATAAHLDAFKARPEHYEPALGGWSGPEMAADGAKVPGDPKRFRVRGGRLVLFATTTTDEAREAWAKDDDAKLAAAQAKWESIGGEARPVAPRKAALYLLDKGGLAVKGYDVVSYFPEGGGKAENGSTTFEVRLGTEVFRFATAAHRDAFLADPDRYRPAYGGWCATAMCKGEKVEIDPTSFQVTKGRLYLFYTDLFTNARKQWLKDEPANTGSADSHWTGLSGEAPVAGR